MTETARLRELLAAATPGPLEHREHDGQHAICGASLWVGEPDETTVGDAGRVAADFALHVAAVNALPSLLDRLEAAEAVVEAARERCDDAVPRWAPRLRAALRRYDEVSRG